MRKVTRTTVFGPDVAPTTEYDVLRTGPAGPRGLKGDPGPIGPRGIPGASVSVGGGPGFVTAIQLTCVSGLSRTAHRIQIVKDGSDYTYGVTQEEDADAGDPDVLTLRCVDDETCHDITIRKIGSSYSLGVNSSVSAYTTFQAAISFVCTEDTTFHYLLLRKSGSRYTVAPT